MAIRLVVDSSSDLPKEFIELNNIKVVPLHVIFGEEEFKDGVTISATEFYEKLRISEEMPSTSQVTPAQFIKAFTEIIDKGDEVICMTIGSNASGTCQSAFLAKNELNTDQVVVVDSNSLCMGTGYVAIMANELIKKGLDRAEIVNIISGYTENKIEHLFCVDTIEYLKKGGRIRASKALVAEILNIKPILNVKDAITQPIGKVRGRKKVIPYYLSHIEKTMDFDANNFLSVAHSEDLDFAETFIQAFKDKFKWEKPIYISEIGATIGTHAGPGVLAAFYIKK